MLTSAEEIYTQVIYNLSPTERLRLANLILNDLVQENSSVVDQSDSWSEQDQLDITAYSLQYAARTFPESKDFAE